MISLVTFLLTLILAAICDFLTLPQIQGGQLKTESRHNHA